MKVRKQFSLAVLLPGFIYERLTLDPEVWGRQNRHAQTRFSLTAAPSTQAAGQPDRLHILLHKGCHDSRICLAGYKRCNPAVGSGNCC